MTSSFFSLFESGYDELGRSLRRPGWRLVTFVAVAISHSAACGMGSVKPRHPVVDAREVLARGADSAPPAAPQRVYFADAPLAGSPSAQPPYALDGATGDKPGTAPLRVVADGHDGTVSSTQTPTAADSAPLLVTTGEVSLHVGDVAHAVAAIVTQVEANHGRVANESVAQASRYDETMATLVVRVPPDNVRSFVEWLRTIGNITRHEIESDDVSGVVADAIAEAAALRTTQTRLLRIIEQGSLATAGVLEVERELTRIRMRLEQLDTELARQRGKIELATVTLRIYGSGIANRVLVKRAAVYPGARLALLSVFDSSGCAQHRSGVGLVMHFIHRAWSLEADVFARSGQSDAAASSRAVIATLGGAFYSDFMGQGRRQFLNPYVGFRSGYGYLEGSKFVLQAEFGVELWKTSRFVIDASARSTGLIGKKSELGCVSAISASVAF